MLQTVESSNKSVIRGSNLRRVQVTSRYLRAQHRALSPTENEADDSDLDSDSEDEDEADEEESADEEDVDASDAGGGDAGDEDDSDSDDGDDDSDSDVDEAPENSGEGEVSSNTGDGLNQMGSPNSANEPADVVDPLFSQVPAPGSPLANSNGNGGMGFSPTPQAGQGSSPSTLQQGAGLNPTSPFGGAQGGSPPQDATESPPFGSVSPEDRPGIPGNGFPGDPNSPSTQFGDTPFLGQGGDWTTTTPPIDEMDSWITPIEPTDEEPGNAAPMDNAGGQGGGMNQPGFPSGENGFATPTSGQNGFGNTASPPFSSPTQGGGFNTQYGNSQYNGNNGGQNQNKGGGLIGAWKNMKNKSVEEGKSSLGEDIKEEEAVEEEEVADEMEGGADDDKLLSEPEESGSKPADADDEFEKMIEDAEGKTSEEKGTSKETEGETFEDLNAEEKEEITEEELEEVEEELKEEEEVAAAAGGMGFLLAIGGMIFTAHQMSENPDGVYASVCRLAITISGVIVKIICMPCRKIIGTGNPHYATHMRVSTSADYGMGGANAGFEMS